MTRKHWIIGGALVITGAMAVFVVWASLSLLHLLAPPETVTDSARYVQVRGEWAALGFVDHFPLEIPPAANAVGMSYFPGYLQGGAHLQLRLRLPEEDVRRITEDAASVATHEFFGGNTNRHANVPNGVPTTFFHTSETGALAFPETYRVFVFRAVDRSGGSWNHGDSSGVAVDEQNSEVVYWADSW